MASHIFKQFRAALNRKTASDSDIVGVIVGDSGFFDEVMCKSCFDQNPEGSLDDSETAIRIGDDEAGGSCDFCGKPLMATTAKRKTAGLWEDGADPMQAGAEAYRSGAPRRSPWPESGSEVGSGWADWSAKWYDGWDRANLDNWDWDEWSEKYDRHATASRKTAGWTNQYSGEWEYVGDGGSAIVQYASPGYEWYVYHGDETSAFEEGTSKSLGAAQSAALSRITSSRKTAERVTELGKLSVGDLIKHRGEHGVFRIQYIDTFDGGRPAEVTAVGGAYGRKAWRTFRIDEVTKLPKKRQMASFDDMLGDTVNAINDANRGRGLDPTCPTCGSPSSDSGVCARDPLNCGAMI